MELFCLYLSQEARRSCGAAITNALASYMWAMCGAKAVVVSRHTSELSDMRLADKVSIKGDAGQLVLIVCLVGDIPTKTFLALSLSGPRGEGTVWCFNHQ